MKKFIACLATVFMLQVLISCRGEQQTQENTVEVSEAATTVFENEFVKVDSFHLKPGAALPIHEGGNRVVYSLSDYRLKWTEGGEVTEKSWQKGDVHWHYGIEHAAENIGTGDAVYLVVTRKDNPLPGTEGYDISQDASQVDTSHAHILFENDHVRVIDVQLEAGAAQDMHQGINRLIYPLTSYQIRYTSDQMETKETGMEAGDPHWHAADQHAVENTGENTAHYLIFGFKQ